MTNSILISYATMYGSTKEVAAIIAEELNKKGLIVDVKSVKEVKSLYEYRTIILGAPLIMFHWHKDALKFLEKYRKDLENKKIVIFALGPVHDPHDNTEWENSRKQLDKELSNFSWLKPVTSEILGGKFDPKLLRFPLNWLAGSAPASDARDWKSIRAWANKVITQIK
jgi:menaquinone-dependent protoporphyrinogen oxidase